MSILTSARTVREYPARYRLEAARCNACGAVSFPPRLVCPSCRGRAFTATVLPDHGTIATFTVIQVAGSAFKHDVPYVLAVVELAGGVRLTSQVVDVDPAKVAIGMPVRLEFRRIQEDGEAGVIAYGHKAVPA